MAGDTVAKLAKPQLRRLFHDQLKRNLITAFVLVIGTGVSFYYLNNRRAINRVGEYYKNYDIEKDFNDIREKGLFDSCNLVDGRETD